MKKAILTFSVVVGLATATNAQLVVVENGQILAGNVSQSSPIDASATINVWGIDNMNPQSTKGAISFGPGTSSCVIGDGGKGTLSWKANNGFEFISGSGKSAMTYSATGNSMLFTSNLRAPSFITTSDIRLKTNVTSIEDSSMGLMSLTPVSYTLNNRDSAIKALAESDTTVIKNDDRIRFGFIAQEVRDIFPNLVVEDEEGLLGIDYIGFIPILVDAVKNLMEEVDLQRQTIAILSRGASPAMLPTSVEAIGDVKTTLKQNHPNPFNTSTVIECTLPHSIEDASIYIYDLQGKQVKRMSITERGLVSMVIDASTLQPGMYIYALIADGIEIDSKKMILTD